MHIRFFLCCRLLVLLLLFVSAGTLRAQIQIDTLNYSRYPELSVRLHPTDKARVFTVEELRAQTQVLEQQQPVQYIIDARPQYDTLSVIVVYNSIREGQSFTRDIVRTVIQAVLPGPNEVAIVAGNNGSSGFHQTTSALEEDVAKVYDSGAAGSLDGSLIGRNGALQLLPRARFKPVIVLCTDVAPMADTVAILAMCRKYGCKIYAFQFSDTKSPVVEDLCTRSGGIYWGPDHSPWYAEKAVEMISDETSSAYTLRWTSKEQCGERTSSVAINSMGRTRFSDVPALVLKPLLPESPTVYFTKVYGKYRYDTTFYLRANYRDVNVRSISSSNPGMDVSPKTFMLRAGDSIALKVSYTDASDDFVTTTIDFDTDVCPLSLFVQVMGRGDGIPDSLRSIEAVFPGKNDVLMGNTYTTITWIGGGGMDTVDIDYSTDGGNNWNDVATAVGQHTYRWSVPAVVSDDCLLRFDTRPYRKDTVAVGKLFSPDFPQLTVDRAGDAVVTGELKRAPEYPGRVDGGTQYAHSIATAKFGPDANLLWFNCAGNDGGGLHWLGAMSTDDSCNIYVRASCNTVVHTNDTTLLDQVAGRFEANTFVICYDRFGKERWVRQLDSAFVKATPQGVQDGSHGMANALFCWNGANLDDYRAPESGAAVIAMMNLRGKVERVIPFTGFGDLRWWADSSGNIYVPTERNEFYIMNSGKQVQVDGIELDPPAYEALPYEPLLLKLTPQGTVAWYRYGIGGLRHVAGDGIYFLHQPLQDTFRLGDSAYANPRYPATQYLVKMSHSGTAEWAQAVTDFPGYGGGYGRKDGTWLMILSTYPGCMFNGKRYDGSSAIAATYSSKGILLDTREWPGYINVSQFTSDSRSGYYMTAFGDNFFGHTGSATYTIAHVPESLLAYTYSRPFSVGRGTLRLRNIDLGLVRIGTTKDSVVLASITNIAANAVTIDSVTISGADAARFGVDAAVFPVLLQQGAARPLAFTFSPDEVRTFAATVNVYYRDGSVSARITGEGFEEIRNDTTHDTTYLTVVVDDIVGMPGDSATVALRVTGISGAPPPSRTGWQASVSWNSSMLFPTTGNCIATGGDCVEHMQGQWNGQEGIIATVPAVLTLGNTDRGTLTLESFQWIEPPHTMVSTLVHGALTLTELCEDGSVRLYMGTNVRFSLAARPNPVSSVVQIQYGVREPLEVTLDLLDGTGTSVLTLIEGAARDRGEYLLERDVSILPDGLYFLRLATAKGVLTTRLAIVR